MELQGKVIVALPERSGVSSRGEWKSQDFVIETHESYPHKMVFSVFGVERLQRFNIQVGQEVLVSFDIDAHEYQGRWFNNINAWQVQRVDPAAVQASVQGNQPQDNAAPLAGGAPASGAQAPFPPSSDGDSGADDLPF